MLVRGCCLFLAVVLAPLVSTAQLGAQSVPVTLVRAGRLLDPRTGSVLAPAAVPIEGDKIKQVGLPSQIGVPTGAKVIDLCNATLLPSLIDSHTHLLIDDIVPPAEAERARRLNFTPTSYGHFSNKAFEGTIAESLVLRTERLKADERNRQRYKDLAQ